MVFWMLIWETVIWDILTKASSPTSRATAAMVTVAARYPADTDMPEVTPPTAADNPIDVGSPRRSPITTSAPAARKAAAARPRGGPWREPEARDQGATGHGSPDRPESTGCPGYEDHSVIGHA